MRTDPRKACNKPLESLLWAWVHDGISHPLMAFYLWAPWTIRIHNFTSEKAWPRKKPKQGFRVYRFYHPCVKHEFVTGGVSWEEAYKQALAWFKELEKEFGGRFRLHPLMSIRWEAE